MPIRLSLQGIKLDFSKFIFLITAYFFLFFNYAFIGKTLEVYPFEASNIIFILSLFLNVFFALLILFSLIALFKFKKTVFGFLILVSSLASFIMNHIGTPIDSLMFLNAFQTNINEALDLLSFKFFTSIFFLGVLPLIFLKMTAINKISYKLKFFIFIKIFFVGLFIFGSTVALQSKTYATFFREHKILRTYVNPIGWIYSFQKYAKNQLNSEKLEYKIIGEDSKIVHVPGHVEREIIILVIGETVRSDHVSLNGYAKKTFPLLEKENVFSFKNVSSCGTSTSISVPCMFSSLPREQFDIEKAASVSNVLDILHDTNEVHVLWRDNNSDSKGVATRSAYENFRDPVVNSECDGECRDVGMLNGLKEYIDNQADKDIMIVLHQMGNHGPAYYKRFPEEFGTFKSYCKTNELSDCSNEEIINAYDNALLYTDFFLSKVIELLKSYPKDESAMIYISDHGESLGENGVYLHGMPYFMAPKAQTHVPAIMWFGPRFLADIDSEQLKQRLNNSYSHDYLFHTLLNIFEVQTHLYDPKLDILDGLIKHD